MRAMVVTTSPTGPTIEQREIQQATRAPGQVLIDVHAASVNRADLAARASTYAAQAGTGPAVVGLDAAGVVLETDAGARLAPGDRVMTLVTGGLAERVVVDDRMPIVLPEQWSFDMGAAALLALLTGHNALRTAGRFHPGDTVLVNAAQSGVGQMTLQLAVALGAGRVLAGVRSVKNADLLKRLGADALIRTDSDGFAQQVLEETDGRGADIVIDHVGGPYLAEHLQSTALGGRIISVGRLGGPTGDLDLETVALKRLSIVGVTFRTRDADEKAAVAQGVRDDLTTPLAEGQLDPLIDRVLPWTDALTAQEAVAADSHLGKIILRVKGD